MEYPLKLKYRARKPSTKKSKVDSSNQAPPRRGRRTPKHLKGVPYPGQWRKQ